MKPLLFILAAFCLVACERKPPPAPLPQRAYVWQRQWTPAVSAAVTQASPRLAGFVIFGAEITWRGKVPKPIRTSIDWAALRSLGQPVGIALRIAPFAGPFEDSAITKTLADIAAGLLERARQEGVVCSEFQIDFDCAQKKLAGYAQWLPSLRAAVRPVPLVLTTLPSWLDEPEFPRLLDQADGYVLQVHSIAPAKPSAQALVCDPALARVWVEKASALGRPFTVALSTYSALAGYDGEGKLLGLALDGVQPAWPAGTKIMQFESDAPALATLVRGWQVERPPFMEGVLWYRLPVETDIRNWRWPTFAAVIAGRTPASRLRVQVQGENPTDLTLVNEGEADETLAGLQIAATWGTGKAVAAEGLPGWRTIEEPGKIRFIFEGPPTQRLSPGSRRSTGWVRFDQNAVLHVQIVR